MQKPIVYAPIPEFDQETQGVFQLAPVDKGDCIEVGVEVRVIEISENEEPV